MWPVPSNPSTSRIEAISCAPEDTIQFTDSYPGYICASLGVTRGDR